MFPFASIILPFSHLSTLLSSDLLFYGEMISSGGLGGHPSCTERKPWLLGRILSEVLVWVRGWWPVFLKEQAQQALGGREGWAQPAQSNI